MSTHHAVMDELEEAHLDREPVLGGIKLRAASYGTRRLVRRAASYLPTIPTKNAGESEEEYRERVKSERLEAGIGLLESWLTIHAVEDLDELTTALEYPSEFRKLVTRTMMRFSEADLEVAGKWMSRQLELDRKTAIRIVERPRPEGTRSEEIPPPNS